MMLLRLIGHSTKIEQYKRGHKMADPVIVDIPEGAWKLIAENEIKANAEILDRKPTGYLFTTRDYPSVAPAIVDPGDPNFEGVPKFLEGREVSLEGTVPTDHWVFCTGSDGKVKVTGS